MATRITIEGVSISREKVLAALEEFASLYPDDNDFESWRENGSYDYAIEHEGRLYPPKQIVRMVTGKQGFKGHKRMYFKFRGLGFTVIEKP